MRRELREARKEPADFDHGELGATLLTGRILAREDYLGLPADLITLEDLLLVADQSGDRAIHVLDRATGVRLHSLGRRGDGPGEFRSPPRFSASPPGEPPSVWALDAGLRRMTRLGVIRAAGSTRVDTLQLLHLPIDELPYQAKFLRPGVLVMLGLFSPGRFAMLDLTTSEGVRFGGEIPGDTSRLPQQLLQQAYMASLAVHPAGELFAIAAHRGSRLEIHRADRTTVAVVGGPFPFDPDFLIEADDGRPRFMGGPRNRYAYLDAAATDSGIFALFSGRAEVWYTRDAVRAEYLHFFDWSGTFRGAWRLDRPALALAVDASRGVMYTAVFEPEPAIAAYPLPDFPPRAADVQVPRAAEAQVPRAADNPL